MKILEQQLAFAGILKNKVNLVNHPSGLATNKKKIGNSVDDLVKIPYQCWRIAFNVSRKVSFFVFIVLITFREEL